MKTNSILKVSIILVSLIIFGCSNSNDSVTSMDKKIDKAGLVIDEMDGVSVSIPPNAVLKTTTLKLEMHEDSAEDIPSISSIFELSGMTGSFEKPIVIELEYKDSDSLNTDNLAIATAKSIDGPWHILPGCVVDTKNNVIRVETMEAGFFTIVSGTDWDTDYDTDTEICTDGDTSSGTIECGYNNSGVLQTVCINGIWQTVSVCVDQSDECQNGNTQAGDTLCGTNNKGVLLQNCIKGTWVDSKECIDPDICIADSTKDSTTVCGFNGNGLMEEICKDGDWTLSGVCNDLDVCTNDLSRQSDITCSTSGTYQQICKNGQWVNSTCITAGCDPAWGIYDEDSKLCWLKYTQSNVYEWASMDPCETLPMNFGNFTDWRAPTEEEYMALFNNCGFDTDSIYTTICDSCAESTKCNSLFPEYTESTDTDAIENSAIFWTSTRSECQVYVDMNNGAFNACGNVSSVNLRCVRDVQ
ncbi:MAG: DUF1566 domain-containing protein [Deltaproteobacteria bacterium]|nr:DUF1566 domain-containing protein [Deltaproteobacteria bacterium]